MYLASYNGGAFLGQALPPPPPIPQTRSISTDPPNISEKKPISKAKSTNSLRAASAASALARRNEQESSFHTILDPRMASTSDLSRASSKSRQGESKDEVAVLSDKLISAINHQQQLDDSLVEARHELEAANARNAELAGKLQDFEIRVKNGELMTREVVSKLNERLNAELEEAKKQKEEITQEKKKLDAEVEGLTASLFDEANKMVASANLQREQTERKNQQLRDQIKDGEALIASQTEQLTELKSLMQELGSEHRKDPVDSPGAEPSSPQAPQDENLVRLLGAINLSPITPDHPHITPSPSTQLTHLIRSQCRTDVPCYDDFKHMLSTSNPRSHTPSHAPSRAGSGSYGGLTGLGLGYSSHNNSSSPNLSTQVQGSSKPTVSPGLPGSFSPAAADIKGPAPLKETRFFKRIMVEDVEPTLRFDLSPQISWLQRRTILAAIADSTLIVEPIPEASQKLYGKFTSCSICGESRREGQNPRTHAMRTREGEGANKWAICVLCLEKVRAVGDLIGYIRMVREGVVKIADIKDEEEAWEEIIRHRERLFWARLAGGVVPAFVPTTKTSPEAARQEANSTIDVSNKENNASTFQTPNQSRRNSDEDVQKEETQSDQEANAQLQAGLEESLTTFANAREKALQNAKQMGSPISTPTTPSRKRQSGGGSFPRISIPRIPQIPQGFWESQVNTLR